MNVDITVIIANIISIVSCTMMVLIGFIKSKEKILVAQCAQFTLMAISHYLLGGMGGVVATVVSILRNIVFFFCRSPKALENSKKIKIVFVILAVVLSAGTVTFNPITWLPVFATVAFTWVMDCEDIVKFKYVMIVTVLMWFVYDAYHLNFVSAAFDAFTAVSTGYSVYTIKKKTKEAK